MPSDFLRSVNASRGSAWARSASPALILPALALLTVLQAAGRYSPAPATGPSRQSDRYLLLVNTAIATHLDERKIAQFDRSPYDGLAVSFSDAYETSPVPSLATMQEQMQAWN